MSESRWVNVVAALSLLGVFACGDDSSSVDDEVGDGDSGETGDGDGDPTSDGDGDPSGDGDGDPTGDGDGDPSGDGDGDPTGDGDGDPTGDGDGDGDPSGDGDGDPGVTYTADTYFGGLDRVFIYRHDANTDTCGRLSVVSPQVNDLFDVTLPGGWSVESVNVTMGVDCPDPAVPIASSAAGTGTIEFVSLDDANYFPCELNIDASFELDTMPIEMLEFLVTGLVVNNDACP